MTTIADFYVTGGTLRRDAPSYVKRQADDELYYSLSEGHFCYVLTSRQMGKSSLMVRTAARLRTDKVSVVVLDFTALGQNVSAEQWYQGLLGLMGDQLDLEDELETFWLANKKLGPLQRWMRAVREVVMTRKQERIVIFVDEIDVVRSLPFSTDELFAAIREFYNRRTEVPEMKRLTFCLLGVATPSDLIRDTRTTPFNIGRRVELADFTEPEASPLAQGFGHDERVAAPMLGRVLYWTGGHPYLTQRLCQGVADDMSVTDAKGVDRVCESLFLSTRARERDDNLLFVRERLLRSEEVDRASLLDLYAQVHRQKRVPDDETNTLISVLRLSGITSAVEGYLRVRNRIYLRVFDREWILANMPGAEIQRQRTAYRKGLRTAVIAVVALLAIAALTTFAIQQRNKAIQNAEELDRVRSSLEKLVGPKAANNPQPQPTPSNKLGGPGPPPAALLKPEMVNIDGGTFQMGLNEVPTQSIYDLSQTPAHSVTVKSFWIDKTEVTNAEYSDFIKEAGYSAPSYWNVLNPPSGQEQWPVTNVSLADAKAFAEWRSKRDKLKYRLPTEEEWEYAARNSAEGTLYPWGNEWLDGAANVDANSLQPVGSHPQGASKRGVLDLIGNAWEWTSTKAAPYPGNTLLVIPPGRVVIRGGAFLESSRGPDAIMATRRSWLSPSDKQAAIGFRLVRDSE